MMQPRINRIRRYISRFVAPVCSDLDASISLLQQRHYRVLATLIVYSNTFMSVYPSQSTLGNHVGYSRQRVNDALGDLVKWGLVSSNYLHMNSCEYKIAQQFNDPVVRAQYANIFKSLLALPIALLCADSGMPFRMRLNLDATRYYNNNSKNNIISFSDIVIRVGGKTFSSHGDAGKYIRSFYDDNTWDMIVSAHQFGLSSPFNIPNFLKSSALVSSIKQVTCDSKRRKSLKQQDQDTPQEYSNPIRESIRGLRFLSLSRWGQIELMQFPDKAIEYAHRASKMATPRDPFKYFISLCYEYCRTNSIAPDVDATIELIKRYNRPEGFLMTVKPLSSKEFAKGFSNSYAVPSPEGSLDQEKIKPQRVIVQRREYTGPGFFDFSREEKRAHVEALPKYLVPLFFKGMLSGPDVSLERKYELLGLMVDMHIPFEGIIAQDQLDQIMSPGIMMPAAAASDDQLGI